MNLKKVLGLVGVEHPLRRISCIALRMRLILLVALFLNGVQSDLYAESGGGPSLEETKAWIQTKLSSHSATYDYVGCGIRCVKRGDQYDFKINRTHEYSQAVFDGCKFSITVDWESTDGKGQYRLNSNLSKLDPLGVKIIQAQPPDQYGRHEPNFSYLMIGEPQQSDSFKIIFTDQEMAERVKKAFARAIKLCGGQVEPI